MAQYQSLEKRLPLTTFIVTTPADVVDPGDGLLSLREAVTAANLNAPFSDAAPGDETGDRIVFDNSIGAGTVSVTEGEITIEDDLIIRGRTGADAALTSVSGEGNSERIFRISTPERVYMRDLAFESSSVVGNGGAGFLDDGSDAVFVNLRFVDNSSSDQGGALFVDNAKVRLVTNEFSDNYADVRGGAIAATESSQVVAIDSTFGGEDGNDARRWGGAISLMDDAHLITNSRFLNNGSWDGGGAINAIDQSRINIFGGSFVGNSGTAGGAIEFEGDTLYISDAMFFDNDGTAGGAISVGDATSVILNSTFEDNFGSHVGGAIVAKNGSELYVSDSTFESGFATTAGAVWVNASRFVLRESLVASNIASGDAGGILFFGNGAPSAELRIIDSEFDSNVAERGNGGAVSVRGGLTVISNSRFEGNKTEDFVSAVQRGGALHAVNASQVLIFDSEFENNQSGDGGAIYSEADYMRLSDSLVASNSSTNNGGGIFTRSRLAIVESTVSGNSAVGTGGGAMAAGEGQLVSRDVLFSENSALRGGAIGIFNARAHISNTRFESNNASLSGGAIISQFSGQAFIAESTFNSNTAFEFGSAINVSPDGLATSRMSRFEFNQIESDSDSGVVRVQVGGFFGSVDDVFNDNSPNDDVSA